MAHVRPSAADPAAFGLTAVIEVPLSKWADAWIAFFAALDIDGLTAMHTFAHGLTVADGEMQVLHCQRIPGAEAVSVGEGDFAMWGWPIEIKVAGE